MINPSKWLKEIMIATLIIVAGLLFFEVGFAVKPKINPVIIVEGAVASIQPMPVVLSAPGSLESIQSVTITPQVTGILQGIFFTQGQTVTAGQLLFEISPASFEASLAQAQAILKRDEVQLLQFQKDAARFAVLVQKEFVTRQQYEHAKTSVQTQVALIASDQAQVKLAQIQLGYTKITAPVAGKTGNVVVRVGNLVTANSPTPILTINVIDPIWAAFSLPQVDFDRVKEFSKQGPLSVLIFNEAGNKKLGDGRLFFIDNTMAQSGSVLVKAEVANPSNLLSPGQLVSVKLILTIEPQALTIPVAAIQMDQSGPYVYVVHNNLAKVSRVTISRQLEGLAVIASGLQAGDVVLTSIPPGFSGNEQLKVKLSTRPANEKAY